MVDVENNSDQSYITELSPADVLFGRGSGPNDHEGNIRFRQLVAERKDEYLATNHRQTKAKIAREIVDLILADHGRFLKKVENADAQELGIPKGLDAWIIVDDDTVMEKAKQALRQNTNKADRRGYSPIRGDGGGLSPIRGNSPVRVGNHSPVPGGGQLSPVPGRGGQLSPVPGRVSSVPQGRTTMPGPVPLADLEPLPLPLGISASSAAQYANMSLQQQRHLQAQVQAQLQQQQQLQQHQQQQFAASQLVGLGRVGVGGVDPWGGSDQQQQFGSMHDGRGGGGGVVVGSMCSDYGSDNHHHSIMNTGQPIGNNSNGPPIRGMGGWSGQGNNSMAAPQPREPGMDNPSGRPGPQVQFSNSRRNNNMNSSDNNVDGWGGAGASEHTVRTGSGAAASADGDEELSAEELRKRRQSLQMEDLMDSMSKLQTGDFSADAKLQESNDTMGTIEPIGAYDSAMSVTSFSSSTFSLYKNVLGESTDGMSVSRGVSRSSSINEPRVGAGGQDTDSSMLSFQSMGSLGNLSEIWGSRGMSLLDRLVQDERERAANDDNGGGGRSGGDAEEGTYSNFIFCWLVDCFLYYYFVSHI